MDIVYIGMPARPGAAPPPDRVGSKAANLARIARIGLRVPPAFVLDTDLCRETLAAGGLPQRARTLLREGIALLEQATQREFGGRRPLLVSVRSSPPVSMPGMLETVLNIGLTGAATRGLLRTTGNPPLVWDTARRFAEDFSSIVRGCPGAPFAHATERVLALARVHSIDELDPLTLRDLAQDAATLAGTLSGSPLPDDPYAQLEAAVEAVFRSWSAPRAREYRRLSSVDDQSGTAVLVQAMAFGNSRTASGSGVGFTRNPSTGANERYVDFAFNAQGEDVVSGRRRPQEAVNLASALPAIGAELERAATVLETEFRDMQDFEFTVQDGELFFLQSRTGKRTPWAALHIAVDLVHSDVITPAEALQRLQPYDLDAIQRVGLHADVTQGAIASGIPAAMGVAAGAIALDSTRARELGGTRPVILVRPDLTTDDLAGVSAAVGLVTTNGGRTSHAAVVARHLGKVCVAGCSALTINEERRCCSFGARVFAEGDIITIDGDSGLIYGGAVPTTVERPEDALAEVRHWRAAA